MASISAATLVAASVDLKLAQNVEFRDRAFVAAEHGVHAALAVETLSTGWTASTPSRFPEAAGAFDSVPDGEGDEFTYRMHFLGSGPAPDAPSDVRAFHFVVEATGRSAGGAVDTHIQQFFVHRPAGWIADGCGTEGECFTAETDSRVRTSWQQIIAE